MDHVIFFLLLCNIILSSQLFVAYAINNNNSLSILTNSSIAIEAIFQFGDSIADTGNDIIESPNSYWGSKPYGETWLHRPTGRCSDGLLIIDFIAQALNLPLLEPYLEKDGDFRHGVNFAVAGATALNVSTLATKGIIIRTTNSSLLVQLDWFKSHLNTLCTSISRLECKQKLENALFIVGEIGGNDYNNGGIQGTNVDDLQVLVPDVIQAIVIVIKELIDVGAKRIIVPGNFAVGCMTVILAIFKVNDSTKYDELNCLRNWNELAMLHNDQLQNAIKDIQKDHRDVAIVYGDYYTSLTSIFKHPHLLGFEEDGMHKACCGSVDNEYNFDADKFCGHSQVLVCQNPNKRVSWDGFHLTQHAYRFIADSFLQNSLPNVINNSNRQNYILKYVNMFLTLLLFFPNLVI